MNRASTWIKCVLAAVALLIVGPIASEASAQTAAISANFGSRAATSYPIPANFFGVGIGGGLQPATLPLLTSAGLTYTRFHANIQDTFATSTPNWTALDAALTPIQAAGLKVILEMDYTPASLQSETDPCPVGTNPVHGPPTNQWTLGAMALAYATHINNYFPGVVTDYEIWNEPDGGGLCAAGNTQAAKLEEYLTIFQAMASQIHFAAAKDGFQVRTGGPALGSTIADAPAWISALLSDHRTAQYVNFVSYHYYVTGISDIENGLTWSGSNGGPSLYADTQSTHTIGEANVYKEVAALVRKGLQPNASTTPIYLDEYNTNWAFLPDCCRNSPTYAPVWNAMVFSDLLNTVYSGASAVPNKIMYYAVSNHPFCIAGTYDVAMDCLYPALGPPTPYPQYYALQLFASSTYLGLQNGGYMTSTAASSSDPTLLTTSFFTNAGDVIAIVNPSSTNYKGVSVVASNTSIASAQGTANTITGGTIGITTKAVSLAPLSNGYSTTVNVPAYSVVAVTIMPAK